MRPCLIHTYRVMPTPCSDHAVLSRSRHSTSVEMARGLPARVRLLPATTRSSTKVIIRNIPISDAGRQCETKQHFSWTRKRVVAAQYKKDYLLNCSTCSLDISGYHADFHAGYGTIGAWHGMCELTARDGRGMAWDWHGHGMGAEWARHAMSESALRKMIR